MTDATTAQERRARAFLRRWRAAKEKRHLPTLAELLLGMLFFGERIGTDAKEFVERFLIRFEKQIAKDPELAGLRAALIALTMSPSVAEFRSAAKKLREIQKIGDTDLSEFALRCDLYAACHGCEESALRIAAEAVAIVERDGFEIGDEEATILIQNALGWLRNSDIPARVVHNRRGPIASIGKELLQFVAPRPGAQDPQSARWLDNDGNAGSSGSEPPSSEPDGQKSPSDSGLTAVVFTSIGNRETSEGRRVSQSFSNVLGKHLPLVGCPNLTDVRAALVAQYPYAEPVIRALLEDVALRPHVALLPTILVGEPGIGKNLLARRFLSVLGVPVHLYPCGGVADASLAGTPRRWSSGEPSLPVALIWQNGCASPGIILDEIEKVGTSRHNGNVLDALLGLFEFQSASAWHDPYVEAPVDLSHVIWIGTANSVADLPPPLRDRCRILRFPAPDLTHLPQLAAQVLVDLMTERGLDPRWASPLSGQELDAIAQVWKGGSVRVLRRLVEGVMNVRERLEPFH